MDVDLGGKVALVTGGTRGLGRQMVTALARCGADVIVTSRRQETCDEVAAQLGAEFGTNTIGLACHVGRWSEINMLVEKAFGWSGKVDILVNNAGISPLYEGIDTVSEELFDKTIAVNLKGPFRLSALVGTRMKSQGSGSIVNISSTAAVKPKTHTIPYAAAKAGLNAMSEGMARALGPEVRVNCIMCGPFQTDISSGWDWDAFNERLKSFSLRRVGQPEEVTGAMLYFASSASSYTTGAVLSVNGGEP